MRSERIAHLEPCEDARDWLDEEEGTDQEIWDRCESGEWMLWLLGELCQDVQKLYDCCREITALKPSHYADLPLSELYDLHWRTDEPHYYALYCTGWILKGHTHRAYRAVTHTPGAAKLAPSIIRKHFPIVPEIK